MSGDLALAHVVCTQLADSLLDVGFLTGFVVPHRSAEDGALGARSSEPGSNALLNHRALELAENAAHLKQGFAGRSGRVNALLRKVKVDSAGVNLIEELALALDLLSFDRTDF